MPLLAVTLSAATIACWLARPIRVDALPHRDAGYHVDVNHAAAWELACLPSIGPAMAQRIIDERDRGGAYRGADDLKRVRGIGDATVLKIEPMVSFGAD
ncbi:MAG: helix-hairpin-helix domain-containing protein [Planctomycetota bacterium]|nr:helix-hairpin-helix domain-containing protein [Planctomycetota bacterium]